MNKIEILPDSINYQAEIIKIEKYEKHPNADRLFIVDINYNKVITGVEPKIGDLMVYFPVMSQIDNEFISFINGFSNQELNQDKSIKGFFSNNCRVKPIKLRGLPSEGYLHPLSDINEYYKSNFSFDDVGVTFNNINDNTLCKKYIIPVKQSNISNNKKSVKINRIPEGQFRLHNDTENLRKNIDKINLDDIIGIHYKKHGTSWVVGNVLVNKQLTWYEKLLKRLGIKIKETEYDFIYSSRKVVKNGYLNQNTNHFFGYDLWEDVKDEIKDKIPQGFTLYGEAIGYDKNGKYIQGGYDYGCTVLKESDTKSYKTHWKTISKKDKIEILNKHNIDISVYNAYIPSLEKIFNNNIPKEIINDLSRVKKQQHKLYVYRITITNSEGFKVELDDLQIKEFCEKYSLNYSDTFLYYGKVKDLFEDLTPNEEDWREEFLKKLESKYTEKNCYMCNNEVPEEGIVLRVNKLYEYEAYKLKSFKFLEYEDKQLESGETNIEDNQ